MSGISKSRVSELCEELDEEVERFRSRPLEGRYPYVWVDATYLKARQDSRVASTAVVIAVGVNAKSGEREVLGVDVGPSEDGAFWTSFLCSLVARGLRGVRLVTSDSHRGLKSAIEAVVQGARLRYEDSIEHVAIECGWGMVKWGRRASFIPTRILLSSGGSEDAQRTIKTAFGLHAARVRTVHHLHRSRTWNISN